ncbi:hypothetical protein MP228_005659 [Amoeboaphelidium protococcarum]|nr:hypothetical protein MP228_005659 [Amoeboaphelidium protococcarum]
MTKTQVEQHLQSHYPVNMPSTDPRYYTLYAELPGICKTVFDLDLLEIMHPNGHLCAVLLNCQVNLSYEMPQIDQLAQQQQPHSNQSGQVVDYKQSQYNAQYQSRMHMKQMVNMKERLNLMEYFLYQLLMYPQLKAASGQKLSSQYAPIMQEYLIKLSPESSMYGSFLHIMLWLVYVSALSDGGRRFQQSHPLIATEMLRILTHGEKHLFSIDFGHSDIVQMYFVRYLKDLVHYSLSHDLDSGLQELCIDLYVRYLMRLNSKGIGGIDMARDGDFYTTLYMLYLQKVHSIIPTQLLLTRISTGLDPTIPHSQFSEMELFLDVLSLFDTALIEKIKSLQASTKKQFNYDHLVESVQRICKKLCIVEQCQELYLTRNSSMASADSQSQKQGLSINAQQSIRSVQSELKIVQQILTKIAELYCQQQWIDLNTLRQYASQQLSLAMRHSADSGEPEQDFRQRLTSRGRREILSGMKKCSIRSVEPVFDPRNPDTLKINEVRFLVLIALWIGTRLTYYYNLYVVQSHLGQQMLPQSLKQLRFEGFVRTCFQVNNLIFILLSWFILRFMLRIILW